MLSPISPTSEKLTFTEQLERIASKNNDNKPEPKQEYKPKKRRKSETSDGLEIEWDFDPFQHDNKTFVVFPDYINTVNAIVSSADILAKKAKHHQVHVFYHGSFQTELYDILRQKVSMLPQKHPERYKFEVKRLNKEDAINKTQRSYLLRQLHKVKPKFVVIGIQGGLSSSLIENEKDVSFRQCIGATPIICKEKTVFSKRKGDSSASYDNVTYAFQVDFSNDAMHAFKLMVDHFENGDTVHLIWVKPDSEASNFQSQSAEAINFVFQPFKQILKDLKLVK